jgi:hypothetical protein
MQAETISSSREFKNLKKERLRRIFSLFGILNSFAIYCEVSPMTKTTKPTRSFSIDKWVLDLTRDLGINRSKIAQEALVAEIGIKLGTLDLTVSNLQQLASVHQLEEKRRKEGIQLRVQRREQEEYVKTSQDKAAADMMASLIKFCADRNVRPDWFSSVLIGNSDSPRGFMLEQQFCQVLEQNNLPADLNLIRPLLVKGIPVVCP